MNPFKRPVFQNLQYGVTPTQPLGPMRFTKTTVEAGKTHQYRVIAVNTVGLKSNLRRPAEPLVNAYRTPMSIYQSADPSVCTRSPMRREAL